MAAIDQAVQGVPNRTSVLPAVIIGLGGTGAEVLLRVRRRLFDESSSFALDEWPIVQFLYLDTDTADKQVAKYNQHLFKLQAFETFPTTIDDYRIYTHHLHSYPSLREWWYPDQMDLNSPMLTTGAGQIRAYGRLAFWHHAAKIRQAVTDAINRATSPLSRNTMTGRATVDNQMVAIYVVGSVAGGTGSGMMMDLGFLLRSMNNTRLEVNAYIVLPGAFQDQPDKVRANGYAALKELEYYCSRRVSAPGFDDRWADNNPTSPIQRTTPFNRVFLFDSENDAGQNLAAPDARAGLVEMIAESIHSDFGISGFAQGKRSIYVNQDAFLNDNFTWKHKDKDTGEDVLTEVWSKSYQAMGLSKLYIPMARIQKSCSALLWSRMFHLFASGTKAGDVVGLREALLRSGELDLLVGSRAIQGVMKDVNDFTDFLGKGSKQGTPLQPECTEKIKDKLRGIRQQTYKKEGLSRHEYLTRQFHMLYEELFVKPSDDKAQSATWGLVPRLIELNRQKYDEHITKQLENAANKMVSDPAKGIGYACEVLESVRSHLLADSLGQVHKFEARKKDLAGEVAAASAEFQSTLVALRNHEEWHPLSAPLLKGLTIDHDVRRLERAAGRWYRAIIEQQIAMASVEMCHTASEAIGERGGQQPRGLLQRLSKLEVELERLSQTLDTWSKQFASLEEDPLNVCVFEPGDVEGRYLPQGLGVRREDWKNANAIETQCRAAATRLLGTVTFKLPDGHTVPLSVPEIPTLADRLTADAFCRELLRQTLGVFERLREINVIDVFVERFPDRGVQAQLVSNLVARARPWFRKSPSFESTPDDSDLMVGCKLDKNNPTHVQWWNLVSTETATADWTAKAPRETDAPWTVIFLSQYAGFPLCYGASIRELRNKYDASIREGRDRLHVSKKEWRFPDLLKLDDGQWKELRRATETFIVGLALGSIKERTLGPGADDGAQASFYCEYEEDFQLREFGLGVKSTAINRLISDPRAFNYVHDDIEKKKLRMRSEPEYRARVHALLHSYIGPGGPFDAVEWDPSSRGAGAIDAAQRPKLKIMPIEFQVIDAFVKTIKTDDRDAYLKAMAELPTYTVERVPGWRVMRDGK